jgi:neutral trehalase
VNLTRCGMVQPMHAYDAVIGLQTTTYLKIKSPLKKISSFAINLDTVLAHPNNEKPTQFEQGDLARHRLIHQYLWSLDFYAV